MRAQKLGKGFWMSNHLTVDNTREKQCAGITRTGGAISKNRLEVRQIEFAKRGLATLQ